MPATFIQLFLRHFWWEISPAAIANLISTFASASKRHSNSGRKRLIYGSNDRTNDFAQASNTNIFPSMSGWEKRIKTEISYKRWRLIDARTWQPTTNYFKHQKRVIFRTQNSQCRGWINCSFIRLIIRVRSNSLEYSIGNLFVSSYSLNVLKREFSKAQIRYLSKRSSEPPCEPDIMMKVILLHLFYLY